MAAPLRTIRTSVPFTLVPDLDFWSSDEGLFIVIAAAGTHASFQVLVTASTTCTAPLSATVGLISHHDLPHLATLAQFPLQYCEDPAFLQVSVGSGLRFR